MTRKITRRDAGRLIAAAPVAFGLAGATAAAQTKPKPRPSVPATSKKSAQERRAVAKAAEGYEKAAAAVRGMKIPIGTEPAFTFHPLSHKP